MPSREAVSGDSLRCEQTILRPSFVREICGLAAGVLAISRFKPPSSKARLVREDKSDVNVSAAVPWVRLVFFFVTSDNDCNTRAKSRLGAIFRPTFLQGDNPIW